MANDPRTIRKSIHEFEGFTEANDRLLDLEAQRAGVAEELKSFASTSREKLVKGQAAALLSGGTLTLTLPTAELQARLEVLDAAISVQRGNVKKQREAA